MRLHDLRRSDDGFTIIELLIAVVILGVIIVPVSNLIIGYLRNSAATTPRLNESHDAQLAAAYFAQDAASTGTRSSAAPTAALAQSIETNAAPTAGLYPCGAAGLPNALIRFAWDDTPSSGTVTLAYNRVAYVVETVSGETQLHRIACAGSSTVLSDAVVAHALDPTALPSPACFTAGGASTSCTGVGTDVPQRIVLMLNLKDQKSTTDYTVALTGQRRST